MFEWWRHREHESVSTCKMSIIISVHYVSPISIGQSVRILSQSVSQIGQNRSSPNTINVLNVCVCGNGQQVLIDFGPINQKQFWLVTLGFRMKYVSPVNRYLVNLSTLGRFCSFLSKQTIWHSTNSTKNMFNLKPYYYYIYIFNMSYRHGNMNHLETFWRLSSASLNLINNWTSNAFRYILHSRHN